MIRKWMIKDITKNKLLVVDDDINLRNLMIFYLKDMGLKTFEAENGKRAIDVFQNNPDIDLIILDMIMPEMGGIQTAKLLKKINPKVKILFISGFVNLENPQKAAGLNSADFLRKPFKMNEFSRLILEKLN